jgi:hypothetical protein
MVKPASIPVLTVVFEGCVVNFGVVVEGGDGGGGEGVTVGVTELDAAESAPVPSLFVAVTVNV